MFGVGFTPVGGLTEEQIKRELEVLIPTAVVRAERNAVNRTVTSVRSFSSKEVRKDLSLKAKTVKDALGITRASRGANPTGEFDVLPKPVSMKRYGARETRKGITVKVKKDSGRKVVKGGFTQKSLGGHVFKRVGEDKYPIKKLWGPSVRVNLEDDRRDIHKHIDGTFQKRFLEQARWEIDKARRRGR